VPVLLIGFNRPNFLKNRIYELSKMPIKHLYISVDGGALSNQEETESIIAYAQKILPNYINLYVDQKLINLGVVKHVTSAIANVLNKYKYLVIVEDDIELSANFYVNMLAGLNLQIKLGMKGIVGASSPINIKQIKIFSNKWRESSYCGIWGWACSKEIWDLYNYDLRNIDFEKALSRSSSWKKLNLFQQQLWIGRFLKVQKNPLHTWDIQLQYWSFFHDFVNMYPVSSLIKNIGFNDYRALHTKGSKPRWLSNKPGDDRLLSNKNFFTFQGSFSKYIDSNTVAGDTRLNAWWNS
jgi:hypothetical protein